MVKLYLPQLLNAKMGNTKQETMMDFGSKFVYCETLGVAYKSTRHSVKGHIRKKDQVNRKQKKTRKRGICLLFCRSWKSRCCLQAAEQWKRNVEPAYPGTRDPKSLFNMKRGSGRSGW
jgi:hypothetical protein